MTSVADIAVCLPISGTLTYRIPDGIAAEITPGKRVVVQVKNKLLAGIVWKVYSARELPGLKPIREIVEPEPVFTPELMKLAEWISDYYVAPLGEVVASMGPPQPGFKQLYRLAKDPGDLTMAILEAEQPEKARILEVMRDGKARSMESLRRKTALKSLGRHLDQLVKQGYLKRQMILKARRPKADGPFNEGASEPVSRHNLTSHQRIAYDAIAGAIDDRAFKVFLLHGVTGSGKTEVYLRAINHALSKGRKALYLVPEIGLTPQVMERVGGVFGGRCAVLHSQLSSGERYRTWQAIRRGQIDVVVGPRSAVFAPLADLGIIVIDEEHDASYKQQESPRYNAREVAIMRAKMAHCTAVLGSATPSMESYFNALNGRYHLCQLPERIAGGKLPQVEIVDLRSCDEAQPVTPRAQSEIIKSVDQKEQVLLFINRRGYSNYIQCTECGYVPKCRNCNVTLTYHLGSRELRCHYCDYVESGPQACPKCAGSKIAYVGAGTQRIEQWLTSLFPDISCKRFDKDAIRRKGKAEEVLADFTSGLVGFLVGTQMVAKGHDFKHVGLVVVANADVTMNLPDFRSAERTFQILTQVAGRAGRGEVPGRVIVQTFNPDHHSLAFVANHDYRGFYHGEIALRRDLNYPPFRRLARIVVEARKQSDAERGATIFSKIANRLARKYPGAFEVVGPARAPLAKVRNVYRWHLLIKAQRTKSLGGFIRRCLGMVPPGHKERFIVDVDPQLLM